MKLILIIILGVVIRSNVEAQIIPTSSVDSVAYFPGGNHQLDLYINKNLNYPRPEMDVFGTVVISFIVDTTGNVSDIRVEKSLVWIFDNEAIRVVEMMPKWVPAKAFGMKVRSIVYLPISFKISE